MHKILILSIASLALHSSTAAQYSQKDFKKLAQLEGIWAIADEPATFETWRKVNDTLLEGKGFSVNSGDTTVNETLTISFVGGAINYTATVLQQNDGQTITFPLIQASDGTFTFENAQHDFPKSIGYTFLTDTRLQITLSGQKEGTPIIFEMNKKN